MEASIAGRALSLGLDCPSAVLETTSEGAQNGRSCGVATPPERLRFVEGGCEPA